MNPAIGACPTRTFGNLVLMLVAELRHRPYAPESFNHHGESPAEGPDVPPRHRDNSAVLGGQRPHQCSLFSAIPLVQGLVR